jgi:hypothetical protein
VQHDAGLEAFLEAADETGLFVVGDARPCFRFLGQGVIEAAKTRR